MSSDRHNRDSIDPGFLPWALERIKLSPFPLLCLALIDNLITKLIAKVQTEGDSDSTCHGVLAKTLTRSGPFQGNQGVAARSNDRQTIGTGCGSGLSICSPRSPRWIHRVSGYSDWTSCTMLDRHHNCATCDGELSFDDRDGNW